MYQTNAKYFEMSKVELVSSVVHRSVSNSVEILIAIKGLATVKENEEALFLKKGQSILIKLSTAYTIETNFEVEIYKVGVLNKFNYLSAINFSTKCSSLKILASCFSILSSCFSILSSCSFILAFCSFNALISTGTNP